MSTRPLSIAVITGTRAEFGIFRPVLDAIRSTPQLRLQLIATGMHLQREFGNTVDDITRSGYDIAARVPMYMPNDASPADALARATAGIGRALADLRSDLVLVLGDRLEILAAANAALALQLPTAHLHGGETAPGQWDEQIRHAVTKMAHLHFVATKTAAARVRQMGEEPARVHVVGAPAIDRAVRAMKLMQSARSADAPPRTLRPLLVYHPTGPDAKVEQRRTQMLIDAIRRSFPGMPITAIGPNNDPGHAGILAAYRKNARHVQLAMNVSQDLFWGLMYEHGVLVGNSSSGIIEAATFGVAVINVGPRQAGRERSGNVIDVDFSPRSLTAAFKRVLSDKPFARRVALRRNVYGDGRASERIVAVLQKIAGRPLSPVKRFHDLPRR